MATILTPDTGNDPVTTTLWGYQKTALDRGTADQLGDISATTTVQYLEKSAHLWQGTNVTTSSTADIETLLTFNIGAGEAWYIEMAVIPNASASSVTNHVGLGFTLGAEGMVCDVNIHAIATNPGLTRGAPLKVTGTSRSAAEYLFDIDETIDNTPVYVFIHVVGGSVDSTLLIDHALTVDNGGFVSSKVALVDAFKIGF